MTPEIVLSSYLIGQRSKSRRNITCAKIRKIINNSAGDCSISLKFSYRLWSRDTWCTSNFQGQRINGQGRSVTLRISIKNPIIQARISCRRSDLVKIIRLSHSRAQDVTLRSRSLGQIFNSAADCSMAFKFGTEFHYITGDTLQVFKIKGQGHGVKGEGHSVK